jgi:N-acetylmuramoyl-L-alanine amidase
MLSDKLSLTIAICIFASLTCQPAQAAEPSVTPAENKVSQAASISTIEETRFVRDYYAALSKSDVRAVVSKFAERVNYHEDGQRDRAYIEKDLRDYVARWPVLSLKPDMIAVSPTDDGRAAITFNVVYSAANESTKKSASGLSTNNWIVWRANGQIQIVSQRELVQAKSTPPVEKTPRSQSHEDEEAMTDEELKKQGDTQIEIPTARSRSKRSATPAAKPVRKYTSDLVVALDIGHSPLKGGAISARGVFEYEFNRRLVAELFSELQSLGLTRCFVINSQGDEIRLAARSAKADEQGADLLLAIHHDSVKDKYLKIWQTNGKTHKYCDDFHGYSIFISNKNAKVADSRLFAAKLGQALLQAGFTPTLHHVDQENRPILDKEKGIYTFDDLVVLKSAKMPAVLLECGVIVNRAEEEKLNRPAYRKRLIGAIGQAIQDFSAKTNKSD